MSHNCTIWGPSEKNKASIIGAIQTALIGLIIFSPFMFTFVNKLLGPLLGTNSIAVNGKPTIMGMIVHGIVAFLLSWLINHFTMNPDEPAKLCCNREL
jgi:hypothetical protein